MIIPSIDLMSGSTVQLVGGREKALDAGDPRPIARRFSVAGEVAVIDLDAALSQGSNADMVRELLSLAPCRVGGGIRDAETAIQWLDAGAKKVILGTAARPEVLRQLPRDRVIAALDAAHGEVVIEGWRRNTGASVLERVRQLRDFVGGFLVTFVEREGRLGGIDLEEARRLGAACGDVRLTVAGGVTTAAEIAALDADGIDAQVGMAIYTGRLRLGDAIAAPLRAAPTSTPNGLPLWPTVVADETGAALGLVWSNGESLRRSVDSCRGVYWSRSRDELWEKGATSGATQELLRIDLDCDRDCLRFTVRQDGSGFCHTGTRTCWGEGRGISALARTLADRLRRAPDGSFTKRLLENPDLLREKLQEEAAELADAATPAEAAWEAADVIYFALVAMIRGGATLEQVQTELDRRALTVTRRDSSDGT